jgi:hypothetical protein
MTRPAQPRMATPAAYVNPAYTTGRGPNRALRALRWRAPSHQLEVTVGIPFQFTKPVFSTSTFTIDRSLHCQIDLKGQR